MLVRGNTVFLVCCSKYVQHAALLYQVNMCTGEDEAWAHRKQSNGNQKDFLFQSSPIFICRGYPIISLITSHTSESIPELFCCTCMYKKRIYLTWHLHSISAPALQSTHSMKSQYYHRFVKFKSKIKHYANKKAHSASWKRNTWVYLQQEYVIFVTGGTKWSQNKAEGKGFSGRLYLCLPQPHLLCPWGNSYCRVSLGHSGTQINMFPHLLPPCKVKPRTYHQLIC